MAPIYQGRGNLIQQPNPQSMVIQWDKHVNSAINAGMAMATMVQQSQVNARKIEYMKLQQEGAELKLEHSKMQMQQMKKEQAAAPALFDKYNKRLLDAQVSPDNLEMQRVWDDISNDPLSLHAPQLLGRWNSVVNNYYSQEVKNPNDPEEIVPRSYLRDQEIARLNNMATPASPTDRMLSKARTAFEFKMETEGLDSETQRELNVAMQNLAGVKTEAQLVEFATLVPMQLADKMSELTHNASKRKSERLKMEVSDLSDKMTYKVLSNKMKNINTLLDIDTMEMDTAYLVAEHKKGEAQKLGYPTEDKLAPLLSSHLARQDAAWSVVSALEQKLEKAPEKEKSAIRGDIAMATEKAIAVQENVAKNIETLIDLDKVLRLSSTPIEAITAETFDSRVEPIDTIEPVDQTTGDPLVLRDEPIAERSFFQNALSGIKKAAKPLTYRQRTSPAERERDKELEKYQIQQNTASRIRMAKRKKAQDRITKGK